ncbi:dehydrogenase/reductase SDR family member 11-like [Paramacrobiotus metropolitanus]|uniref:dehydrogenase/reductase SDR family member 11-like n=1 Tax=Paramacrobiotus metropolitanus TaxID=2943436 RepID=UPI0024456D8A|nr:dehydrogenase/reductase SDR family member 11-like [Paramacrobiotus metropolitanus]
MTKHFCSNPLGTTDSFFATDVYRKNIRLAQITMERWKGRTALVTGASSGIGYAIADALAGSGMKVVGCARNLEKIHELAKKHGKGPGSIEAIKCDVSQPQQIAAMFEQIRKQHGHVDVLVNNAGVVQLDSLLSGRTEKWREMLEINVLGLSVCAREALKLMQQDGVTDGNIININSYGGHIHLNAAPYHFYSGTKHMITSLTESLHREVRAMEPKNNIRVTDISPGVVATDIFQRSAASAEHPPEAGGFGTDFQPLSGEDIANSVLYILGAPQHVNVKTFIVCPTKQPSNTLPKGAGTVRAIKCDIFKEEDIKRMFAEIEKTHKHVDVLVNNAGMAKPDTLSTGSADQWREMIDVNVMGLSICAREALRLMAKNQISDGHIININSMAGHSIPPMASTHFYSATKHMVIALTEALYREVKDISKKIRVTSISPGAVQTDFSNRWVGEENVKQMQGAFGGMKELEAQDIANAIAYVVNPPLHVCIKELIIAPTEQFAF